MRIQNSHGHAVRDLDAYFSPPEAALSLLGSIFQTAFGSRLQATELSSIPTPRTRPGIS
jgi:hypothetical protein